MTQPGRPYPDVEPAGQRSGGATVLLFFLIAQKKRIQSSCGRTSKWCSPSLSRRLWETWAGIWANVPGLSCCCQGTHDTRERGWKEFPTVGYTYPTQAIDAPRKLQSGFHMQHRLVRHLADPPSSRKSPDRLP